MTREEFTLYCQRLYGIGSRQAAEYMGDRTEFDDDDLIKCYNRYRDEKFPTRSGWKFHGITSAHGTAKTTKHYTGG